MFKISIVEKRNQRRLMLEGSLIRPWTEEVRKLVVDLTNVTYISADGETTLIKLMRDGAKFSCRGVLTKHVLKQLAGRCRCTP